MESSNPPHFKELCFSTGPSTRALLRERADGWLSPEVPLPGVRALVMLAVEEAVLNVVEHGYRWAPGQPIQLRFIAEAGSAVRIQVLDRAPVTDVTRIQVPTLAESAERLLERGRGLAILRRLSETILHQPRDEGGNVLDIVLDVHRLSRLVKETYREAA